MVVEHENYGGLKEGEVDLGTSIMAVKFNGGVVLGADSRTSTGVYIANRVTNKVTPLFHGKVYLCRSGSAADSIAVSDIVKMQLQQHAVGIGRAPSVNTAASLLQNVLYENKGRLQSAMICAGYDEIVGDGSVYSIPLGGAKVKQPFAIGGSGSTYIYGYCDKEFKSYEESGMGREDARKFVENALAHAMGRDGSSGGCIRTVTIDKNGIERGFISGDQVAATWQSQLKQS